MTSDFMTIDLKHNEEQHSKELNDKNRKKMVKLELGCSFVQGRHYIATFEWKLQQFSHLRLFQRNSVVFCFVPNSIFIHGFSLPHAKKSSWFIIQKKTTKELNVVRKADRNSFEASHLLALKVYFDCWYADCFLIVC